MKGLRHIHCSIKHKDCSVLTVSVLIEKKKVKPSQEVFLLTDSFLCSNALKKELAELYVVAIMAAMHWC